MAGLLDSIGGLMGTSFDDPKATATLRLAQGLLTSPKAMQGLSGGLLGYQEAMQEAKKRQAMEQMQAMQMQQQQMALAQAQSEAQRKSAIEQAYRSAIRTPEQMAMAGNGGPTMAAADAAKSMAPGVDQAALLRGLAQADPQAAFAMMQPKQKELARIEQMRSPDNKGMVNVAFYKDGTSQVLPYGVRPDMIMQDLGGKITAIDKNALQGGATFSKSMSPDAQASNALGWANNKLSRERLSMDQESAGGYDYRTDASGNLVALPKKPTRAGPITAIPVAGMSGTGAKEAKDALSIIEEARATIPKATSSGLGAAVDAALGAFGVSTEGGDNAGKLKALEGALVAKMPKMSGPQSDKDVLMYRQMAAEIGNPSTPASRRLAALDTVEKIQRRYAGAQAPASPASGGLKFLGFED